jgi:hypothetical protein
VRQRIRTIKPELFTHEALYDLEQATKLPIRLAWCGLLTCCDREGRFNWRPRELKTHVLPYDDLDFVIILDALAAGGLIVRYTSSEHPGETFGAVPSWRKHQIINNREGASEIPDPEHQSSTIMPDSPRVPHACPTRASNPLAMLKGNGTERNGTEPKDMSSSELDESKPLPAVEEVFEHWKTVMGKRRAVLDVKRRRVIAAALKNYDLATLCASITGYSKSAFHMGQNETHTRYDEIGRMLSDSQHIEAGLGFGGPVRKAGPVAGPEATREYMRKVLEA